MKTIAVAAVAAAALAVPAAASAHVTLNPREATAGSFGKLDVRVPNERDNKGTIKVDVRLPDGLYFLSYQKVPGWKVRVYKEKLDQPVDLGGFSVRGVGDLHRHGDGSLRGDRRAVDGEVGIAEPAVAEAVPEREQGGAGLVPVASPLVLRLVGAGVGVDDGHLPDGAGPAERQLP